MTITPAQVEEAHTLLGWSVTRLASRLDISEAHLRAFLLGDNPPWFHIAAVEARLEALGIEFIAENGGGAACG